MIDRPLRTDYRRWLDTLDTLDTPDTPDIRDAQTTTAPGESPRRMAALPELPARLPFPGHVVWFHESQTYLDIRFDHHRFEIVTQQVPAAAEAFYFDSFDAAYGHAADIGEPCLILFSEGGGAPVSVVG
ncbi:hypothetical protein [Pandoraea pulmonicola]|uniref:Uncharacterized protein n=1 Tax=Pandoraea pulmonicola TaxID=93221 RepID=A0AAJ4ZFR0_PANPU|nr:hypothetical protein [Pandoraea pulmonicola]AJC19499.1 hypothetical protein RO07_01565 [Pandoraea pulmonicola]SUA92448.1 Uncharacterised protein [Pandoraea pulmonicola]